MKLLQKGLNFAITPRAVPTKEILASVEQGVRNLTEEDQNEVRQKVTSTLKQAKAPRKQNLSSSQTKALKGLKTDHSILITKADKGNSTVVMDRSDYIT
jgi:hypothetical protein